MNSEPKTEQPVINEEPKAKCSEETTEEKVDNECGKEAEVTKNEETVEEVKEETQEDKTEEVKEETVEEVKDEKKEEEEKEVIKIEALNSAPIALKDVSGKDNWENLHGNAFWDYLAKHPELTR